jgi:hypothetical protein
MNMGICVCEATRFEFNLNSHIRFKPTEVGKTIFKAHWMPYSKNGEGREIKIDDEGWAEMQLWEFMNIYGQFMRCGMNVPVETLVILIDHTTEEQIQALKA